MDLEEKLINKRVDVSKNDGFHLYGVLREIGAYGIWLKTSSETSFIAFTNIKEIRLDRRQGDY